MTPRCTILSGDATARLRGLASGSVDCVITSPPYFLLRDYDVAGQLGLEDTVEEWVGRLRAVMAEVARVLTPTGSVWLNLGDAFSPHPKYGAPAKSLLLAPERLAIALLPDGWTLRNRIIWAKTNPMPEGVRDRLSVTYDTIFFLVRSRTYYFDLDAIREPAEAPVGSNLPPGLVSKNPGDVWRLPGANYPGAHFATYPESLIERPILASCPAKVCTACGTAWPPGPAQTFVLGERAPFSSDRRIRRYPTHWRVLRRPTAPVAGCDCQAPTRPGLVLDPFLGSGTTAVVAERLGRDWLGIELNPDYVELAWERIRSARPPTAEAA
ncbi:MAG TPA: site-specific DNA-methyltransferase [Acidimicrobiales bacterium]|nr:site-specific DNA-methyltransferase [Acidimicrobiales bacterium]